MSDVTLETLRGDFASLLDRDEPLDSRMRQLYRLKESYLKTPAGALLLIEAIDTTDSVLLQHEMAYNVGQSGQADAAVPGLSRIVRDRTRYDLVTRHEAAESLGALGSLQAEALLIEFSDPAVESEVAIRESCALALARVRMAASKGAAALQPPADCPFVSIDPSPAFNEYTTADGQSVPRTLSELATILLDDSGVTRLFDRYMAMFSLRNIGSEAAVHLLGRALLEDKASALFRHEVAFVLGQLEAPCSQPALVAALKNESEAAMVRHEAAEALGAIADPMTLPVLAQYASHSEPLVRDSCVVALEMHRYWSQYTKRPDGGASDGEAASEVVATM